jgi:hypothetical protein
MKAMFHHVADYGYPHIPEQYKRLGSIHCLVRRGFTALCFERSGALGRELIVTLIVAEHLLNPSGGEIISQATELFSAHCERFSG